MPFGTGYPQRGDPPAEISSLGPTFKNSDGSINNIEAEALARFGMPQYGNPLADPYGRVPTSYETFPEAWGGPYKSAPNMYINTLLITQIADTDRFIINRVFPIRLDMTGATKFQISEIRFHDHELDRIPELGVPRLTQKSSQAWEVNTVRHGLAFFMEHGFALTDVGRRQYDMSITQIRNATWETMEREAYAQLLATGRSGRQINYYWAHFGGKFDRTSRITQIFDYECSTWGILNRRPHGITQLIDAAQENLKSRIQTEADICIGPHGFRRFIGRRPEVTKFSEIGETARNAHSKDEGNFDVYGRNMEFIETRLVSNFINGRWNVPEDPFVRSRTIGEYFQVFHPCASLHDRYRPYMSDIVVHDNDSDQMANLSLTSVEMNCAFNNEILEAIAIGIGLNARATWGQYIDKVQELTQRWSTAVVPGLIPAGGGGGAVSAIEYVKRTMPGGAGTKIGSANNGRDVRDALAILRQANVASPFNYIILRPFERWQMGSLVFTLSGGRIGFTSIGQHDFQLQNDGVRKYLTGTFTVNLGVVMTRHDGVYIAHNAKYVAYENGGGTRFFTPEDPSIMGQWNNDIGGNYNKSLIVLPLYGGEILRRSHIDTTGFFTQEEEQEHNTTGCAMHYSSARAGAKYWNFMPTTVNDLIDNKYFNTEGSRGLGSRCSQGHQLMYAPDGNASGARQNAQQITGRGHHGPYTYAGVRDDRCGVGENDTVLNGKIFSSIAEFMIQA